MTKNKSKTNNNLNAEACSVSINQEEFSKQVLEAFSKMLDMKKLATSAELIALTDVINKLSLENQQLRTEVNKVKFQLEMQGRMVEKLQNDQLNKNLMLYGMPCEEDNVEDKLKEIFNQTLKIENNIVINKIDLPKISGPIKNTIPPIKITLNSEEDVATVLKNCHKLKTTKYAIQRDLVASTRKKLSKVVKIRKEIKKNVPTVKTSISRDELIIEGQKFIWIDGKGLYHVGKHMFTDGLKLLQEITKLDLNYVVQEIMMAE